MVRYWAMLGLTLMAVMTGPQTAHAYESIGAGNVSCGTWVADHRFPNSNKANQEEEWVVGFLTGMAYEGDVDPLRGTDFDGVVGWIDNYCVANPVKDVLDAAAAFARYRAQAH